MPRATHIFTLGPAAILSSRRVVQSVVDAATAPSKRISYRNLLDTTSQLMRVSVRIRWTRTQGFGSDFIPMLGL